MPSHNCIIISQCSVFKVHLWISSLQKKLNETLSTFILNASVNSFWEVVGQNGLEPSTSRLSVVCSSQLSYWPIWWRLAGSNRWPPACKAGALPAELNPHIFSFVEVVGQDSLSCGKATAVATLHRTVAKCRLSSPFWLTQPLVPDCRHPDSFFFLCLEVVGQNGLEPSTSRLSVVCSSQLSYWPILDFFTS